MNHKTLLFGLLLLLLTFPFIMMVRGDETTYEITVDEDDRFTYTLTSWNEDLADKCLGSDDPEDELGNNAGIGKVFSYEIDDIDDVNDLWSWVDFEYVDGWIIDVDYWGWTDDESDFDHENDANESFNMFDDPSHFHGFEDHLFNALIIPTPVVDYLEGCEWGSDYACIGSEVTRIGDINETREWNDFGVLNRITVKSEDGIIYEITMQEEIPFWIIPLCVGIVGAISIIIIVAKRLKNKRVGLDQDMISSKTSI